MKDTKINLEVVCEKCQKVVEESCLMEVSVLGQDLVVCWECGESLWKIKRGKN